MYADTFKLVFVKGTDGNTIKTSCYDELEPYADTLTIIFTDPPTGIFLGDELAPGSFSPVIEIDCHRSEFYLNLSEPVKCSSIDPTGADFQFFDGPTSLFNLLPISQVDPVCSGGRTQKLKITTAPLDAGTYIIRSSRAVGLSSFETVCGTPWPHDSILIQSKGLYPKLGNDTTYCIEDSTFYMALHPGNFHKYLWDNSDTLRYRPISDSGTYWVAVFNKYGCVNIDTIVVSAIVCNTGFGESNHQSIKIFPNPTSNLIYIQFEEGMDDGVIELYNTLGDRLISQRGNENERSVSISLKEFESGVYFLKVRLRNDVIRTERIIYKGN